MADAVTKAKALAERIVAAGGAVSPATPAQIAAAEEALGRPLPADLRALYAVANGAAGTWFAPHYRLASLEDMTRMWKLSMDLAADLDDPEGTTGLDGAQSAYFVADWFPVLDGGDSTFLAYDNAPAEGGVAGQLVGIDPSDEYREVASPSLWQWLDEAEIEVTAAGDDA